MGRVSSVVILISLVSALEGTDFYQCGRTSLDKKEGYDAVAGEFPHMCSIYLVHNGFNVFLGGASLVSPDKLITLASAVKEYKASEGICQKEIGPQFDLFVDCGSLDLQNLDEEGEQNRKVTGVLIHPDFNEKSLINDVAVLIVGEEFEYNERVGPVCLPDPGDHVEPATECLASGHGKSEDGQFGFFSNKLKKVTLPIWSSEECQKTLNNKYFQPNHSISWRTHESFLCAGGEEMQDTCEGDGGGPLVCYSKSLTPPSPSQSKDTPDNDPVFSSESNDVNDPVFSSESNEVNDPVFSSESSDESSFSQSEVDIFGDGSNDVSSDAFDLRETGPDDKPYLIQYGVTAWGIGCAMPGIPSVYSSLASPAIRCWLEQVINCQLGPQSEKTSDFDFDLRTKSEPEPRLDQCGGWLASTSGKKVTDCGCKLKTNTDNNIGDQYDLRGGTEFDLRTAYVDRK